MGRVGFGVAAGCAALTCVVAAVLVGRRARRWVRWRRAVELLVEFEEGCETTPGRLRQVVDALTVEMHAGLASDGGSKLKMLLTFIDSLPDGSEEGSFHALDLGGTNFRVLRVHLGGKGSMILSHQIECQPLPQELMSSTSENLFDFIALTLKRFIERGEEQKEIDRKELAFTFSFPVRQISVSSGILIKWTKGFSVGNAVGKDVTQCLEEAMIKRGLNMRVAALVNDTVGTLALGHYYEEDTVAAVIIGTGTNACYIERTDAIIKCQGLLTNSGGMVINMEWGNFWSSHLPRTSYDIALDDESPNRSDQGFEKMISGRYLGEIARRVLHKIAEESDILGDAAENLSEPFSLRVLVQFNSITSPLELLAQQTRTRLMAAMHEDDSPDLREVGIILEENLQMPNIPLKTRKLIVRACDIVTRRAARLTAAGIVGILKKIGRDGSGGALTGRARSNPRKSVIAIDGGLYTHYSLFREYLDEALVDILGEEAARNVVLRVSQDGSGIGAALLAAAYSSGR